MKMQCTQVATSADVKAYGGPANVHKLSICNTGSAGTAGWVELRDALATPGDSGTLRYRVRFLSGTSQDQEIDFAEPIFMPQGIRVVLNTVTNTELYVVWA